MQGCSDCGAEDIFVCRCIPAEYWAPERAETAAEALADALAAGETDEALLTDLVRAASRERA